MRTALVRVDVDPGQRLSDAELAGGVRRAESNGADRAPTANRASRASRAGGVDGVSIRARPGSREVEILVESASTTEAREHAGDVCREAFGTAPTVVAVAFLSRGTDEDARDVLEAFGLSAQLDLADESGGSSKDGQNGGDDGDGGEVAIVTIAEQDRPRVPESRLHTALEAALNREIRIRFA